MNIDLDREAAEREAAEMKRRIRASQAANKTNTILREEDDEALQERLRNQYHENQRYLKETGQSPTVPVAFRSNIEVTGNGLCATEQSSDPRFMAQVKERKLHKGDKSKINFEDEFTPSGRVREDNVGSAKAKKNVEPRVRPGFESNHLQSIMAWDGAGDNDNYDGREQSSSVSSKAHIQDARKGHSWVNFAPVSSRDEADRLGKSQQARFNPDFRPNDTKDILGQGAPPPPRQARVPPPQGRSRMEEVMNREEPDSISNYVSRPSSTGQTGNGSERSRPDHFSGSPQPRVNQKIAPHLRPAPSHERNPITGDGVATRDDNYRTIVNAKAKPRDTGGEVLFLQPKTDSGSPIVTQRETQRDTQRETQRESNRYSQRYSERSYQQDERPSSRYY